MNAKDGVIIQAKNTINHSFKGTGTQKNRKKTIFFEFLDYTFFDYFEPSFTYISMLDKEFLR